MKTKYWLCKRKEIFFSFDSTTGKRESLHTADREAAKQIIRAKNDAATQPAINISIAKAYLVGTDPKLVERTWAFVIQEFCAVKKDSSRLRRERAIKSPAFNFIRNKRLVETTADDFQNVLKSGGVFTQHTLRCLHNLALGMGWILAPVNRLRSTLHPPPGSRILRTGISLYQEWKIIEKIIDTENERWIITTY